MSFEAPHDRRLGREDTARRTGGILLVLMLLVGSGGGVGAPQDRRSRVLEAAIETIDRYPRYTIFDFVAVAHDRGTLTLTGEVTMPFKRDEIGRRVRRIEGVDTVENQIVVLPVSIGDDRLRQAVARSLYGSPSFWQYAAMSNPPIHVIVEHGRVTLKGVVTTEVEKHLARSLASVSGAFTVRSELLTEAEWRASLLR